MKQEVVEKILQQTSKIYETIAWNFSQTRQKPWPLLNLNQISNYLKEGDWVLDLGCGNGRLATMFVNLPVNYLGIDQSNELIKIAKQQFANQDNIKFLVGDILKIDYQKQFDLVLLFAVLHHLPTPELRLKVLKNVYQALKPNGRLIMTNWNLWQIFAEKKFFRYFKYLFNYREKLSQGIDALSDALIPWKPLATENWRYVHSFNKKEVKKLLKQAGLIVEEIDFIKQDGSRATIFSGSNLLAIAKKK